VDAIENPDNRLVPDQELLVVLSLYRSQKSFPCATTP
jgi:hypothetical protein